MSSFHFALILSTFLTPREHDEIKLKHERSKLLSSISSVHSSVGSDDDSLDDHSRLCLFVAAGSGASRLIKLQKLLQ